MAVDQSAPPPEGISRRHFMTMSAMAGGGLLVACNLGCQGGRVNTAVANQAGDIPLGDIQLGDFIRIDADNHVTVLVGATELGQGILTGLAMVVAEELDADWSKVSAQHSPVNNVYGIGWQYIYANVLSATARGRSPDPTVVDQHCGSALAS